MDRENKTRGNGQMEERTVPITKRGEQRLVVQAQSLRRQHKKKMLNQKRKRQKKQT